VSCAQQRPPQDSVTIDPDLPAAVASPYDTLDMPPRSADSNDCNSNGIDDRYDIAGYIPRGPYSVGDAPGFAAVREGTGLPDLVVANTGGSTVSILRVGAERRLFPVVTLDVESQPSCIAVADLNADGREDLAVAHYNAYRIKILYAGDEDTYSAEDLFVDPDHFSIVPRCVVAEDLDGDGIDVVATSGAPLSSVPNRVTLFSNGRFDEPQHLAPYGIDSPDRLVAVNFDTRDTSDDGLIEVCLLSRDDPERLTCIENWLEYDPTSPFENWPQYRKEIGMPATALAADDLDGDGHVDIAVVGEEGIAVLINTGGGMGYCDYWPDGDVWSNECLPDYSNTVMSLFDSVDALDGIGAGARDHDRGPRR
jgi:hypothetical protein